MKTVTRHLSGEELKRIDPVLQLKDQFAPNAQGTVSPTRSANSETSIRVDASYQEMLQQVREDLRNELKEDMKSQLTEERKKLDNIWYLVISPHFSFKFHSSEFCYYDLV